MPNKGFPRDNEIYIGMYVRVCVCINKHTHMYTHICLYACICLSTHSEVYVRCV